MAASECERLCFLRETNRRAKVSRIRVIPPTTPPGTAALFDLWWGAHGENDADDTANTMVAQLTVQEEMSTRMDHKEEITLDGDCWKGLVGKGTVVLTMVRLGDSK